MSTGEKVLATTGGVALAGGAGYGGYKLFKHLSRTPEEQMLEGIASKLGLSSDELVAEIQGAVTPHLVNIRKPNIKAPNIQTVGGGSII